MLVFQVCSQNNSNNNIQANSDAGSHSPPLHPDSMDPVSFPPMDPTPLMFCNPAYNLSDKHRSSRTSLSQLHDSLNLHNSSMLRKLTPDKKFSPAVQQQDKHQSEFLLILFSCVQCAIKSILRITLVNISEGVVHRFFNQELLFDIW